jgi:hypothetical protein
MAMMAMTTKSSIRVNAPREGTTPATVTGRRDSPFLIRKPSWLITATNKFTLASCQTNQAHRAPPCADLKPQHVSGADHGVAQISNLLYRRFPIGWPFG